MGSIENLINFAVEGQNQVMYPSIMVYVYVLWYSDFNDLYYEKNFALND